MTNNGKSFAGRWVFNAFALYIVAGIVPGFYVMQWGGALAALITGLVHAVMKQILQVLKITVNMATVMILTTALDMVIFLFLPSLLKGFVVYGWFTYLFGGLLLGVINGIITLKMKA